jgi:asparagine N-glycosylation enzyme membrane subunit Stt3
MKKEPIDLSTLSTEELTKKAKTTKMVSGLLAGMLLIEFAAGLYLTITQGFSIFIVLPIAFLPILIINYQNIKKLNEEIARREK